MLVQCYQGRDSLFRNYGNAPKDIPIVVIVSN